MFAYNTSPVYFFDALSNLQQLQQLQLQQHREQLAAQRPKIIKKVETEDVFQIQIHKNSGDFHSYEVKVIRAYGNADLVNLIIESKADEFSKVFQFHLDDIEVSNIDWEYFERDNVLVLNVPKKVKFCADDFTNSVLCSLFGVPARLNRCKTHDESKRALYENRKEQRRQEKRARRAEIEAKHEAAHLNELKLAEEAKKAHEAELERARRAREEQLRKAEELKRAEEIRLAQALREEQARKEQEKKKREEERRRVEAERKKDLERAAERLRQEQRNRESEHERLIKQQQMFLNQLFGNAIFATGGSPPFVKITANPTASPTASPTVRAHTNSEEQPKHPSSNVVSEPVVPEPVAPELVAPKSLEPESSHVTTEDANDSDEESSTDTESILSDLDSPPTPSKNALHRHPSLEEIEDEEFVMFRKKFGDQK